MNLFITKQRTRCFLVGFIIGFLFHVPISQATEFYLSVAGNNGKEHCESLEIRGKTAACINEKKVTGYELGLIREVEIIDQGKITLIGQLTPDSIKMINSSSQNAREYAETVEKIEHSKIGYLVHKLKHIKSFADLQRLGEKQYQKYGLNGALHLFLPLLGVLFILVGSLWFIIVAFRVHILWGLGCLLIPFVSLFFLFFHWRAAAKPFLLSVFGIILALSGIYLFDTQPVHAVKERATVTSPIKKSQRKVTSRFRCQGKIYCSEMTSCAEAKFYLKNCPGVKIDGDNDGVPCERQWCK